MLGAIIGDIVGSRFEWNNHKSKDFQFFSTECFFTDDSVMTLAVGQALLNNKGQLDGLSDEAIKCMRTLGRIYPNRGYGESFFQWLMSENPVPYYSYGNGAAMRVSACGYVADSLTNAKDLSRAVTKVTHNHPEGIKGAEAVAVAVYMACQKESIPTIKRYIANNYYAFEYFLKEIREYYEFDPSCQGTVPQAMQAFFESTSFEDAIRNAISIGGDSDTIGAITGGIAGAYYGIPDEIRKIALCYLDKRLLGILKKFEKVYGK